MLSLFALQLIAGISLMWCLMPRSQVTAGFFRIQMLLVLGLSVVVGLFAGYAIDAADWRVTATRTVAGLIAAVAYVGSVVWTLDRRSPGTACVFAVWGLATIAVSVLAWNAGEPSWLTAPCALASAASMGGAVTGMLLGHWYLTVPTMSIAPLVRMTWYFLAAIGLRLLLSALGWLLGGAALHGSLPHTWFALRWLAGILGPLVLCGMTLRILRYRNTQAATGVLFAAVILTFIGEMSATLLLGELHRPL
jgi:hypothetical protein